MMAAYLLKQEGLSGNDMEKILPRDRSTIINSIQRFYDLAKQQPWRLDVAEEIAARAATIAGYKRAA